ncbi:CheR family methyltransferase [Sphingomonas montanisoli]|uniref:Protein-glutamate O-methyltransferase CheR n=1 Tax=Sphingomonas montanisoli TaxID=2606412 RepID=A0A5D9C9N1_9SPHN|nr:protein-glutamate O-methyltransferase CheR [Sphingomonas montanisoli]TZG28618.1 protein-glutamate O-methyltransferase CheR [Sphingomonas montanisoli]
MDLSPATARQIARIFEKDTGQRLGDDRLWRVNAMLTPLCRRLGVEPSDLAGRAAADPRDPAMTQVVDALLNNETSFFRDGAVFRQIQDDILPELALRCAASRRIRIWSAGCATGQEPYSIAMLFAEDPERWQGWSIEILGTDMSRAALKRASAGNYTAFEVQRGLPGRLLGNWFVEKTDGSWTIVPQIAAMVRFAPHNLMRPPPGQRSYDLVLCRNALLYFPPHNRAVVLAGLAAAMKPDAALILGAGETAGADARQLVADADLLTVFRHAA